MPQVVEAKPPWIVFHQLALIIEVGAQHARLGGCWPDIARTTPG
jgi:hypothetical protein